MVWQNVQSIFTVWPVSKLYVPEATHWWTFYYRTVQQKRKYCLSNTPSPTYHARPLLLQTTQITIVTRNREDEDKGQCLRLQLLIHLEGQLELNGTSACLLAISYGRWFPRTRSRRRRHVTLTASSRVLD